jgi:hypothetical protein
MLTAAGPADPVATHERLAARLAAGDVAQGGVQLVELGVQEVDRAQGQVHGLAGDGGQLEAGQPGAALIGEQPGAFRQAVVVQHGVDALMPGGALVHQRFAQPHLGADVSDVGGRDPGLGQRPTQQQVTQVVGVGPVGLGPPLGPRSARVSAGSARWARNPAPMTSSATYRQPVVPSKAKSACCPANCASQARSSTRVAGWIRP